MQLCDRWPGHEGPHYNADGLQWKATNVTAESDTPTVPLVCPCCELEVERLVERLVVDDAGGPQESEMCERCHRCSEIMAADVRYLVDPRYNLASLSEPASAYMRRMHEVLL